MYALMYMQYLRMACTLQGVQLAALLPTRVCALALPHPVLQYGQE